MNQREHNKAQPLWELAWLIYYFKEYAREDLAQELREKVTELRNRHRATNVVRLADWASKEEKEA